MATRTTSTGKLRLRNGKLALTVAGPAAAAVGALSGYTDYLNQQIFQRLGTSRTLTVNMTCSGGAPAGVEAQVVDFTNNNTVIVAWTALANLTANGTSLTGQLNVPQGGWYKLQIRSTADRSTVISGTTKFGVGAIICFCGQSNMHYFNTTYSTLPNCGPRSIEYISGAFRRIGQYNDAYAASLLYNVPGGYPSYSRDNNNLQGDALTLFVNDMVAGLNIPVLAMPIDLSGFSIDYWIPASSTQWQTLATAIAAVGGDAEMFLWWQGESDAVNKSQSYMNNAWDTLRAQFYAMTGRTSANSHFGIVSLGQGQYNNSTEGQFGAMRQWQISYGTAGTQGVFYLGAAHDVDLRDAVHMSAAGLNKHGRRWGKAALYCCGIGSAQAVGPYVTGATYSAGVVTVTLAHTGGTALVDGSGGGGTALTGFEFKDAGGTVLTITSTSIASANTLQFAVSGTPATVSYAMMNYPHYTGYNGGSTFNVASVVYDNLGTGYPLRPFAAIPIT
jgi:hypothetical protein